MAGLGWQELLIVIVMFALLAAMFILPIWVVVSGSKRRTGQTSTAWVVLAICFGWLGVLAWAIFGSKSPSAISQPPPVGSTTYR